MVESGLLLFAIAATASFCGTHIVLKTAVGHGWIGRRFQHHLPGGAVPRLGGIAIFAAIALAVLAGQSGSSSAEPQQLAAVLLASACVFFVGLVDDCRGLAAWTKFTMEIVAGLILYIAGLRLTNLGFVDFGPSSWLGLPLTVFWVVSVTNALNLVDGLDGLAGGLGVISALSFAYAGYFLNLPALMILGVAVAGAFAGFLPLNFSPAQIFMGDGGSLVLGTALSGMAILLSQQPRNQAGIATSAMFLAVPALDVLLAFLRRLLKGKSIFEPDCEHLHHKLLLKGFSVRASAVTLYATAGLFSMTVFSILHWPASSTAALTSMAAITAAGLVYLGYHHYLLPVRRKRDALATKVATGEELRQLCIAQADPEMDDVISPPSWEYDSHTYADHQSLTD